MPKILELKVTNDEVWTRIGSPGDFESGVALWAPDEQAKNRNEALEDAARLAEEAATLEGDDPYAAKAIRELKSVL